MSYYSSIKKNGNTFDIFKNPSRKELSELRMVGDYGYRIIIETNTRSIFFASDLVLHRDMFKCGDIIHITGIKDFDDYLDKGVELDHVLTVDTEWNFGKVSSGALNELVEYGDDMISLNNIKSLLKTDMSFVDKYFPESVVRIVVAEAIVRLRVKSQKVNRSKEIHILRITNEIQSILS